MSAMGKRLTALEEIAEAARRRELRDLVMSFPESHGLTPAEMEEAVTDALRLSKRYDVWQRAGLSVREIYYKLSAEFGVSSEMIEAAFHDAAAPAPSP